MRDPKRIRKFCNQLATLWERVPDWRFGQLMSNVLGAFVEDKKRDIFYPEDEDLFAYFEKYFDEEIDPRQ